MVNLNIQAVLEALYPQEIVEHLLRAYEAMENSFRRGHWQNCTHEAEPFIDAARRLLDHQLLESYVPVATSLGPFTQTELSRYEAVAGQEEYRVLLPRVLYAMHALRHQHGHGRAAAIDPGRLDATFLWHAAQWVLAELVRLSDASTPDEARTLIAQLLER